MPRLAGSTSVGGYCRRVQRRGRVRRSPAGRGACARGGESKKKKKLLGRSDGGGRPCSRSPGRLGQRGIAPPERLLICAEQTRASPGAQASPARPLRCRPAPAWAALGEQPLVPGKELVGRLGADERPGGGNSVSFLNRDPQSPEPGWKRTGPPQQGGCPPEEAAGDVRRPGDPRRVSPRGSPPAPATALPPATAASAWGRLPKPAPTPPQERTGPRSPRGSTDRREGAGPQASRSGRAARGPPEPR